MSSAYEQMHEQQQRRANGNSEPYSQLAEWDAGDDLALIPARGWLLGNIFCRRFLSMLLAAGGTGKTALRYAQYLSLASGKSLTGEHVFQRSRVLIISLEDDADELRRRIRAVMIRHSISADDLRGWLFLSAPGRSAGKLATADRDGIVRSSALADEIERVVAKRGIDLIAIDPFVKSHSVGENSNDAVDAVAQILTDILAKHNIAGDAPHHVRKGGTEPGNADAGRGASAARDAARLVYTLAQMTPQEAETFGIPEQQRQSYVRMDSAKVNITAPLRQAHWFRLVGIPLGNATEMYPAGDTVQTVEPWVPPETWGDVSSIVLNEILTEIDAGLPGGNRYSDARNVAEDRAAWRVITRRVPDKPGGQAREIIRTWVKSGVLVRETYENPATRKDVIGLRVDNTKRPT
jgi:hypothetical protein